MLDRQATSLSPGAALKIFGPSGAGQGWPAPEGPPRVGDGILTPSTVLPTLELGGCRTVCGQSPRSCPNREAARERRHANLSDVEVALRAAVNEHSYP